MQFGVKPMQFGRHLDILDQATGMSKEIPNE